MNERKKTSGFPWHLWAVLLLAALITLLAYRLFPPRFQLSSTHLALEGETCVVEFGATNHTRSPIAKTLKITIFNSKPGNKFHQPIHQPLAHRDVPVVLSPSETRRIRCDFPTTGAGTPNLAEVTIIGDAE